MVCTSHQIEREPLATIWHAYLFHVQDTYWVESSHCVWMTLQELISWKYNNTLLTIV